MPQEEEAPGSTSAAPTTAKSATARRGLRGLWDRLLAWKLKGLPPGLGTFQWLCSASFRMPTATVVALGIAWTGVVISLWVAAFSAIGSIVVTAFGVAATHHLGGVVTFNSNTSGGIVFLSAIAAAVVGFGSGFAATYAHSLFAGVSVVAAALAVGILVGLVFALVSISMEWKTLEMRGYRRPSERELNLYLDNAMETVMDAMELREVPRVLIMDTSIPQAWTFTRTIVLSKGLLEGLDAGELAGVIAHEMTHWRNGDSIALRMIWSFSWPVAVLYSVGMFLQGSRYGIAAVESEQASGAQPHVSGQAIVKGSMSFLAFLGWLFLWPAWLLTKVLVLATASETREIEYQADAGAAACGLEGGLVRGLDKLSVFEFAGNAWDAALTRSHPPIELRIETLEEGRAVPLEHPEEVSAKRVGTLVGAFLVLVAFAVSPHVPTWHHRHENWWW